MKRCRIIALWAGTLGLLWHGPAAANMLAFPFAVALALSPLHSLQLFEVVIVVEMVLYDRYFDLGFGNAVFGAHLANVFSAVAGFLPVAYIGAPIEEFLGAQPISEPLAWAIGLTIAAAIIPLLNALLEYPWLRLFGAPRAWRTLRILFLINLATTLPFLMLLYTEVT